MIGTSERLPPLPHILLSSPIKKRVSAAHLGECGPCTLCKKESNRYMHPVSMDQTVLSFIDTIEGNPLNTLACICHAEL